MYCPRVAFLSKRYCRVAHYLLALISIVAPVCAIDVAFAETQIRIELFTTTDLQFIEPIDEEEGAPKNINLQVYELDGIQFTEAELSRNLSAVPAESKQILLQRIQCMDEQTRMHMQHSAIGLARAIQYGIDRYPAIVFDGQTVVYGVTDWKTALSQFKSWQARNKP